MFRSRPSPSPGPRWEALKEPSSSSADEDEIDEEEEAQPGSSAHPRVFPAQLPGKRKEDWMSESISKRARYSEQGKQVVEGSSGSRSSGTASAPVAQSRNSLIGTSAISTRIGAPADRSNDGTSISVGPRPSTLMLPPPLPSRLPSAVKRGDELGDIARGRASPSRSQYSSISRNDSEKQVSGSSSLPAPSHISMKPNATDPKPTGQNPVSSQQKDILSSLSRNLFSATASSSKQAGPSKAPIKPKALLLEVIEISDDEPSPPPRSKGKQKVKSSVSSSKVIDMSSDDSSASRRQRGRKSTGGWRKSGQTSTKTSQGPVEIIEIIDSDEEPTKISAAFHPKPYTGQNSDNDRMDVDFEPPSTVASSKKQAMHVGEEKIANWDNMSRGLAYTPPPAQMEIDQQAVGHVSLADGKSTRKPEFSTPGPSSSKNPISSPGSMKKPANWQGFNPIPVPAKVDLPSPPPKHKPQTSVKTASAPLQQRKGKSSSSSPYSNSESEESSSSRQPSRTSSSGDAGIDMRNLSDALGINEPPNKSQTHESTTRIKQQPTSPQLPRSSGIRRANLDISKFATLKSMTGAKGPRSLADTITSAGKRNTKDTNFRQLGNTLDMAIDLTSDTEEVDPDDPSIQRAIKSSMKMLPTFGRKDSGSGAPSAQPPMQPLPGSSRSSTDELILRSAEPVPTPPASLSPQLTSPSIPAIPSRVLSATPSENHRPLSDARHNSAPSLGEAISSQITRAQSPLARSVTSPKALLMSPKSPPLPMRLPARSTSASLMPQLLVAASSPQKSQVTTIQSPAGPSSSSSLPIAQILPKLPETRISAPLSPLRQQTPVSMVPVPEKPAVSPILPAANAGPVVSRSDPVQTQASVVTIQEPMMQQTTSVTVSVPKSDLSPFLDIPLAMEEKTPNRTLSDDEAVRDADECQALLEETGSEMDDEWDVEGGKEYEDEVEENFSENPDEEMEDEHRSLLSEEEQASEVLATEIPSDAALLRDLMASRSALDTPSEAGPSRSSPSPAGATRRSSRRSSRSSSDTGLGHLFDDDYGPIESVPPSRSTTPEETGVAPRSGKTYGGFAAITWKDYRQNLANFKPKVYYAKDLPHALQDNINNMSEGTRMMPAMRDIFQAMILENTVDDEPDAPPIEILNDVDEEPTPPWEFYYTNRMWHGKDVPDPDIENLVSCTCKGACNPRSKTCACLKRQRELVGDPNLEFAYDKYGKLKIPGYPIFECNDLCGCSEECRNRVVQQGRKVPISIKKTEKKGWGVFAGPQKKISKGTYIGIYSGELLTDKEAHDRGIKYNKFGRTYLFDIDFHHLKGDEVDWTNQFTVDAYHAGNFTRFLNHSCDPNSRMYACYTNEGNIHKPLLVIFSIRDIEPNEEICFNYQGRYPGEEDDDEEEEDGDEDPNEDSSQADGGRAEGRRDKIYTACMCGAKNCTGIMFR